MNYRKLNEKDVLQLKRYIHYSENYLKKLETGKEPNLEYLGEIGMDFPDPGVVLKIVPFDSSQSLYNYFRGSIRNFSNILKRGRISERDALELRLDNNSEEDGERISIFDFD
jgi:hypothetical protein